MSSEDKRLQSLEWDQAQGAELFRGGFLTVSRRRVRGRFQDGAATAWYEVETVSPPFLDAVVLLLYARQAGRPDRVVLRRAARPAVALRSQHPLLLGLDGGPCSGLIWELPAGGVEPSDLAPGGMGVLGRASREALEEAGFALAAADFHPLGPPPLSAPAFCPERLHYLAAAVDPAQAQTARGDGHPMEEGAQLCLLELDQALAWCASGRIVDGKTELGLRRLADWLRER